MSAMITEQWKFLLHLYVKTFNDCSLIWSALSALREWSPEDHEKILRYDERPTVSIITHYVKVTGLGKYDYRILITFYWPCSNVLFLIERARYQLAIFVFESCIKSCLLELVRSNKQVWFCLPTSCRPLCGPAALHRRVQKSPDCRWW
jgi:hypothetical protein